jgi:nucleotidyltransferase substrate binding protein (TIGR01987 family)
MVHDIRWLQRYAHLKKAVELLGEPIARGVENLSALEREGTAQRFEVAVELAWKTTKDYLEAQGMTLETTTPRAVVKAAFGAGVLRDGQAWIDMLVHRNLLAHTYSEDTLSAVVTEGQTRYLPALQELTTWLAARTGA